jgi:hypothetical protein
MAINPHDIHLSKEQQRRLAKVAEQNGTSWQEVLDDALTRLECPDDEMDLAEEYQELFPTHELGQQPVSLEWMRHILSQCSGSLSEDTVADREDRF